MQNARYIADRVAPDGLLALSGILAGQANTVIEAYCQQIEFESPETDDATDQTWVRLVGKRN